MSLHGTYGMSEGGIQDSAKGLDYQLKLFQLLCLKAYHNKSFTEFYCSTENPDGEKFDDVVLEYKSNNTINAIYLQAKNLKVSKPLTFDNFFTGEKFHLYKYFTAYEKIKKSQTNQNLIMKEVILCTNNEIPSGSPINLVSSNYNLSLSFVKVDHHEIFKNHSFKLKLLDTNLNFLKDMFLAIELAKFLFEGETKNLDLLKNMKDFCLQTIFDEKYGKFKAEFLNPGASNQFRECFKMIVLSNSIKIPKEFFSKISFNFWNFFKKIPPKFTVKDKISFVVSEFKDNEAYVNSKISDFMSNFLMVSNLKETKINSEINTELKKNFPQNYKLANTLFCDSIRSWLQESKKACNHACNQACNQACKQVHEKIGKDKIDKIINIPKFYEKETKFELLKRIEFKDGHPLFLPLKIELQDFLDSSSDKVVIYETFENETHWASLMLYQNHKEILYLNTKFEEDDFENALEILESENRTVVIECTENLTSFVNEYLSQFLDLGNIKLILVCDKQESSAFDGRNFNKIVENQITCANITDNSLKFYLDSSVNFQGVDLELKKLIDLDGLKEIPVRQLNELNIGKKLGEILHKPLIYLSRKLYHKSYFDPKILSVNFPDDVIVFDENNFQTEILNKKSVHLMETNSSPGTSSQSAVESVLWKKSNGSILALRTYLDLTEKEEFSEEEFFKPNYAQMVIIEGVAGMGKTEFAKNVCFEIKKRNSHFWVQNINLNQFSKVLDQFEKAKLVDDELILKFFIENFMKADNDLSFKIASTLFKTGRSVIFLDGYDEVCSAYQTTVIRILSALMNLSPPQQNMFFISTRTEWCSVIEDKFLSFSYLFQPFSIEDQINFLMKFLDENDNDFLWKFLDKFNMSLTDIEKKFVGAPLTTRLIGERFKLEFKADDSKDNRKNQMNLLAKKVTLFDLLNHFVEDTIVIYHSEKLKLDITQQPIKSMMDSIKRKYREFAFNIIFNKNDEAFPLKRDEDLLKCGLVNDQFVFQHFTIAENLVTHYFIDKSRDVKVLKLVFKKVLLENGYQIIRSFINCCIDEIVTADNRDVVVTLLRENIQVLNVAAKESNAGTFEKLFDVLTEDRSFADEEVQSLLFEAESEDKYIVLNYFLNCEITLEFLEKLKQRFGLQYIKSMLEYKIGSVQIQNINRTASYATQNYGTILNWIVKEFPNDAEFFKKFFLIEEPIKNAILLSVSATENSTQKTYTFPWDIIEKLEVNFGINLLEYQLVDDISNSHALVNLLVDILALNQTLAADTDKLIEIFDWLLVENSDLLKRVVYFKDDEGLTILHKLCIARRKKDVPVLLKSLINWMKANVPNFDFNGYVLQRNNDGRLFLSHIIFNDNNNEAITSIIEMLDWLLGLNSDLTIQIVYSKTNWNRTILHDFCMWSRKKDLKLIISSFLNWMTANIPDFDMTDFVMQKDRDGEVFLKQTVRFDDHNEAGSGIIDILDWFILEDPSLLMQIIFNKNNVDRTVLHDFCEWGRKKDIPDILKAFLNWSIEKCPHFDLNEFAMEKGRDGKMFISQMVRRDDYNEGTSAIIEILNWLLTMNPDFIRQIFSNKDFIGQTVIHDFCMWGRKKDLPGLLQSLQNWTNRCDLLSDFNFYEFLLQKDNAGMLFLSQIVRHDKKNEAVSSIIEILDWIKQENHELLRSILSNKNEFEKSFLSDFCSFGNAGNLSNLLEKILIWLQKNHFDVNEILTEEERSQNEILRMVCEKVQRD